MNIISTNPSRNYEVIGSIEAASEEEINAAVAAARKAQPAWAHLGQEARNNAILSFIKICQENAEAIALAMSREMGKPITQARRQVVETFDYFHSYMGMAREALKPEIVYEDETKKHTVFREPLGVIVAVAPWNFPFLCIPWQAGQALLSGNAILYKPSKQTIIFGKLIRDLVQQSDIPPGIFTVILGDSAVGEILVQQPVEAILFTGSTKVGQRITELAAKTSTRVFTEMGGSSPGIVFEDADIPKIIGTIYEMRFDNTGQYCDGLKRLLVHESKLNEVLQALEKVNTTKKIGDALDERTDIGPLVNKEQLVKLKAQLQDALDKGAKVVFGGMEPKGLSGAYFEPTVLTNINFDMKVWMEEVFGPVLAVVTFKTEAEAIKLANDTEYGLSAFVFTEDKERYERVARQLKCGLIGQNNALFYSSKSPFGGYKGSGNSRTNGIEGFHEVTQIKLISEEK